MSIKKRKVDVVVISDVHLGTFGCRAKELLSYLKTIKPKKVILNGDIIDIWQYKKRYFPKAHMKVVKHLMGYLSKGTEVIYIPGNHDETLRKFENFDLGGLKITNQLTLTLDGKKCWFFHGDVFDFTMQNSKWLCVLGGWSYDMLIILNNVINYFSSLFGKGRVSLSKKIKNSVKSAVKYINDFEEVAAEMAIKNNCDYVVCGHIHQPQQRTISTEKGSINYLNSGDWIENLTALEYHDGAWTVYEYAKDPVARGLLNEEDKLTEVLKNKELFKNLVLEFQTKSA